MSDRRHRGFAFVSFATPGDAQDAIDNMDMNVFHGKVIKCSIATSTKMAAQPAGNRAGVYLLCTDCGCAEYADSY